jgi:hypothetical protein
VPANLAGGQRAIVRSIHRVNLRRTPTCGYVDNASALPTDPQDQKTKASVNLIALKAQRSNQVRHNPDHQAGQPPHAAFGIYPDRHSHAVRLVRARRFLPVRTSVTNVQSDAWYWCGVAVRSNTKASKTLAVWLVHLGGAQQSAKDFERMRGPGSGRWQGRGRKTVKFCRVLDEILDQVTTRVALI